ncbi:MAG: DNA mismatch repair endonuclease MutL [Oscillospiraceae bacterium]|nr:DNA mismatch repair endonuclease MutL [Oscillospiraceae bacterium]
MSQIKVLSKDISELIAAGEVIERPASVIKELIENSIDAGAEHITVEIKKGGTVFMRITDDGCGMEYEDVPTAFLRHATSKISAKDDLDNIMTLGFRGEALASVSAVSKVDVMTKRKSDEYGTHYITEGSIEKLYEKSGCPDGTTIIIRDLFFNVPVRRNFMKKDVTEGNAVSKIVQKTALSHPEVSFKFIRDGKLEFNSSGDGNIYSAIYAVYGKDFANDMVAVKYSSDGIEIGGFVIKPLYAKSNRTFQNFFVNGRYVKSLICQVALESAYNNLLMTGKFPACILTISVKPSTVDVNIHPSKAEVRFSDEKKISDSVYFAVKNALLDTGLTYEFKLKNTDEVPAEPEKNFGSIFTKPEDIEKTEQKLSEQPAENTVVSKIPFRYEENNIDVKRTIDKDVFIEPEEDTDIPEKIEGFSYIDSTSFEHAETPPVTEKLPEFKETEKKIHVIGEAFKNYIMAEADDNIIMIDKHAAHERVIFERLKNQNCRQYMQMILSENKILLSDEEFSEMETNSERLGNMGFLFDYSQKPYIILKGVPDFLKELDMEEIIPEIAENFIQCRHNPEAHAIDDILHTMACKSAIKANDTNDISELQKLAEIVYNDENIRHCPHGRPVMFTMTKNNIERQFRRKL